MEQPTMTNGKSVFPIQLPFRIPETFWEQWEVTVLAKIAGWPGNVKYQWLDRFSKERPDEYSHRPRKIRLGNEIAWAIWFIIAEKQFTARDLLMAFSQDRLCVADAFCLSDNTF